MAKVEDKLVDLKSLKAVIDQLIKALSRTFGDLQAQFDDLQDQIYNMQNGNVDVVRQSTHHTDYTKDTLEFVTDSTGKVINAYFMSK